MIGAARIDGEVSSSSSVEDATTQAVPCGSVNVDGQPLPRRFVPATSAGGPWLRGASTQYAARNLVAWTREGGAVRALLVVSVGSVILVPLTALLIFIFFLVVATTNAILLCILVSLVAVGGFLTVLLAFLALMYNSILPVALFVISSTILTTVVAITIGTGWVAFFWIMWFSAKKSWTLLSTSPYVSILI